MSDSMIDQSVARLFAGNVDKRMQNRFEAGEFCESLWTLASESGFDAALAAEAHGGIGATWGEAGGILRGIGYWQVPLPLAETMIGTLLLSLAGIERPAGPCAVVEQGLDNSLVVSGEGAAQRWSGTAYRVHWARHAPWAVVSCVGGGIALIDLRDRQTIEIVAHANTANIPADTVIFKGARALASAAAPLRQLPQPVWTLGAMARSVMMVGALERAMELSIQYAKDRVQFGRAIGRNQAVQQQLALLAGDVAAARIAALVAASDAPSQRCHDGNCAAFSAAVAKIRCGEAATRVASIAHQVHGAIGFTREHALHFSTRRLWSWREEFGADAWWARRLGEGAIRSGAAAFWPALTQRAIPLGRADWARA